MPPSLRPAVFLDRDGVIIENRLDYVRSWDDVEFIPSALEALARLSRSDYAIVITTNQSAIGRGYLSRQQADAINQRLVDHVRRAGGRIDGVFLCPHAPDDGCECRKPKPGLLFRAAEAMGLDLSRSIMIGDTLSDVQAGAAAGIGTLALVQTGLGAAQQSLLPGAGFPNVPTHRDLLTAVEAHVAGPA
ncbi:MAG TPA: D-glycero-beta-D-manno-heptose 1,7-bisphosphate 7-phosphatase [Anaerolineales bacterium]|nr:D-glycero-beta-D-manno-heptose 1,7-bisphosphate 7-phosphatase [Anaerolineales bacterium]